MWWRPTRAEFDAGRGEGNGRALRAHAPAGHVPGLLAYRGETPVGGGEQPRAACPRLAGSRNLAPADAASVRSVTCFHVAPGERGRGVTRAWVEAAAAPARAAGATLLEAYPSEPRAGAVGSALYTAVASTFRALGFAEVARRAPARPIARLALSGRPAPRARGRAGVRSTPRSSRRRASAARPGR